AEAALLPAERDQPRREPCTETLVLEDELPMRESRAPLQLIGRARERVRVDLAGTGFDEDEVPVPHMRELVVEVGRAERQGRAAGGSAGVRGAEEGENPLEPVCASFGQHRAGR